MCVYVHIYINAYCLYVYTGSGRDVGGSFVVHFDTFALYIYIFTPYDSREAKKDYLKKKTRQQKHRRNVVTAGCAAVAVVHDFSFAHSRTLIFSAPFAFPALFREIISLRSAAIRTETNEYYGKSRQPRAATNAGDHHFLIYIRRGLFSFSSDGLECAATHAIVTRTPSTGHTRPSKSEESYGRKITVGPRANCRKSRSKHYKRRPKENIYLFIF